MTGPAKGVSLKLVDLPDYIGGATPFAPTTTNTEARAPSETKMGRNEDGRARLQVRLSGRGEGHDGDALGDRKLSSPRP